MIHLTLAIADFMMILITAALSAMGWIVGAIVLAGLAIGAVLLGSRAALRHWKK